MLRPPKSYIPIRFYLSPARFRILNDWLDSKSINLDSFCRCAVEHLLFMLVTKPGNPQAEFEFLFDELKEQEGYK